MTGCINKKKRKKTSRSRNISMRIIACAVVALLVTVSVRSYNLFQKKQAYNEKQVALTRQIASEQARSEEINAYAEYVGTDEYVEQIARDRLGLAYPNEILFRPEE